MLKISILLFFSYFLIACSSSVSSDELQELYEERLKQSYGVDEMTQNIVDESNLTYSDYISFEPEDYAIANLSPSDEAKFLDLINALRAKDRECGDGIYPAVHTLKWSDHLYGAAYEHNYDMVNSGLFSHTGSGSAYDITGNQSSIEERVVVNGYLEPIYTDELISHSGALYIDKIIDEWLNNPKECAKIMSAHFSDMGLSKVEDPSNGEYYWTLLLASQD